MQDSFCSPFCDLAKARMGLGSTVSCHTEIGFRAMQARLSAVAELAGSQQVQPQRISVCSLPCRGTDANSMLRVLLWVLRLDSYVPALQ